MFLVVSLFIASHTDSSVENIRLAQELLDVGIFPHLTLKTDRKYKNIDRCVPASQLQRS